MPEGNKLNLAIVEQYKLSNADLDVANLMNEISPRSLQHLDCIEERRDENSPDNRQGGFPSPDQEQQLCTHSSEELIDKSAEYYLEVNRSSEEEAASTRQDNHHDDKTGELMVQDGGPKAPPPPPQEKMNKTM